MVFHARVTGVETILVNFAGGKVRRVTENGRRYLVAPLSLIVPGVLNGSKGALLYELEELQRTVNHWDGIPITLNHPEVNGRNVSAQHPGILDKWQLGFVRKPLVKNKLKADGWFDEEWTKERSPETYNNLIAGRPMELSTGLDTDNVPVGHGSHHNGRPYTHIATNHEPDHLAVLPFQTGACSLTDGCGVLVNSESGESMIGTKQHVWNHLFDWLTGNQGRHPETGHFLPHGAGTGSGPVHEAASKSNQGNDDDPPSTGIPDGSVVAPLISNDDEETVNGGPGSGPTGGKGKSPLDKPDVLKGLNGQTPTPQQSSDIAHQASAKAGMPNLASAGYASQEAAQGNHGEAAKWHDVAAKEHVQQFGMKTGKVADAHAMASAYHQSAAMAHKGMVHNQEAPATTDTNGGNPVSVKTFNRAVAVQKLTANCKCDKDKTAITNMSDETLKMLVGNDDTKLTGERVGFSEEGEVDPSLDPEKVKTAKSGTAKTMNELLANATPEDREVWNMAKEITANGRTQITNRLVAGITDPEAKKAATAVYNKMSLVDIKALAVSMPAPSPQEELTGNRRRAHWDDESNDIVANFMGANGGGRPATNADDGFDRKAILPLPTMNWENEPKEKEKKQA